MTSTQKDDMREEMSIANHLRKISGKLDYEYM